MPGKGQKLSFAENFALSGAAAVISKTAAAPIERVKLLVQNQAEMLKQGRIDKPYSGVIDCTTRTMKTEGKALVSLEGGGSLFASKVYRTPFLIVKFCLKIYSLRRNRSKKRFISKVLNKLQVFHFCSYCVQ